LPTNTDKILTKKDNIDEQILGSPPQNFCNPKCKNAMINHRIFCNRKYKNAITRDRIFCNRKYENTTTPRSIFATEGIKRD
jgi:hypothetical protein